MGWFWNKSSSQNPTDTDPLRDLDPSLRDFLSKESPVKYKPAPTPPPSPSTQTTTTSSSPPVNSTSDTPQKSPESLYQDGRFAHLWSTYRPLAVIENETKSDQERLSDVLEGYKERKAQIGRAAVENCVEEQIRLNDCYEHGSWRDRIMMCRTESKAFERCYIMQSRFLKALGYLSTYDRPSEIDESIQMHADTLYHRMLAQEKATDEAKAAGQPAPTFAPILSGGTASLISPQIPYN
ncbi:hypothetical protein ABVK25_009085 [Lepraria finkii]|uniref:Uncharacterized protein n=1 Tax=Lepraria finkii TaxID=1340010 RepID=A0ABR4AYG6_9LECA